MTHLPFTLDRPLVVFDLETTSANPKIARIVEASFLRFEVDGSSKAYSTLINPGVTIPAEATAIHGITTEAVATAPTWVQKGAALLRAFHHPAGVFICGYRVSYDDAVMRAECDRAGIDHELPQGQPRTRMLDVLRLWQRMEPRSLGDAVQRFCGRVHEGAHRGESDLRAALDVLGGMYQTFSCPPTALALADLLDPVDPTAATSDGKLRFIEGGLAIAFGKYDGVPLRDADSGFLRWMLKPQQDFAADTKRLVHAELKGRQTP